MTKKMFTAKSRILNLTKPSCTTLQTKQMKKQDLMNNLKPALISSFMKNTKS